MKRFYLKDLRKKLQLSLEEIAFKINVSYNYILNIENGHQGDHASFMMMGKLAKAYQISLDDLYRLEMHYQIKKGKVSIDD